MGTLIWVSPLFDQGGGMERHNPYCITHFSTGDKVKIYGTIGIISRNE